MAYEMFTNLFKREIKDKDTIYEMLLKRFKKELDTIQYSIIKNNYQYRHEYKYKDKDKEKIEYYGDAPVNKSDELRKELKEYIRLKKYKIQLDSVYIGEVNVLDEYSVDGFVFIIESFDKWASSSYIERRIASKPWTADIMWRISHVEQIDCIISSTE